MEGFMKEEQDFFNLVSSLMMLVNDNLMLNLPTLDEPGDHVYMPADVAVNLLGSFTSNRVGSSLASIDSPIWCTLHRKYKGKPIVEFVGDPEQITKYLTTITCKEMWRFICHLDIFWKKVQFRRQQRRRKLKNALTLPNTSDEDDSVVNLPHPPSPPVPQPHQY
jgi:hypothetical protein